MYVFVCEYNGICHQNLYLHILFYVFLYLNERNASVSHLLLIQLYTLFHTHTYTCVCVCVCVCPFSLMPIWYEYIPFSPRRNILYSYLLSRGVSYSFDK